MLLASPSYLSFSLFVFFRAAESPASQQTHDIAGLFNIFKSGSGERRESPKFLTELKSCKIDTSLHMKLRWVFTKDSTMKQ